ncbi:hypothetical protein BC937DRAFT_94043, partial [Endogone sp. FLAS-F59071]
MSQVNELRAYAVILGFLVFKLFTSSTIEEFVSVVGLYGKLINLFMFYSYGKIWWVVGYSLGWAALFALIQQPPYQGATNIVSLTAAELRSRVMRLPLAEPKIVEVDDQGKTMPAEIVPEGAAKHYIILIWAPWSIACLNFEGVMADLSLEYSTKDLVFGKPFHQSPKPTHCIPSPLLTPTFPPAKFNIDEDSAIAKDLMISDSALSPADLPTVILFTEGKEVRRLPELVLKSDEDKITGFGGEVSQEKVKDSGKDIIKRLAWDRSKVSEKSLGFRRVYGKRLNFFFFL